MCTSILHGRIDGTRRRGRPRRRWTDDVLDWSGMSIAEMWTASTPQKTEHDGDLLCRRLWPPIFRNEEGTRRRRRWRSVDDVDRYQSVWMGYGSVKLKGNFKTKKDSVRIVGLCKTILQTDHSNKCVAGLSTHCVGVCV